MAFPTLEKASKNNETDCKGLKLLVNTSTKLNLATLGRKGVIGQHYVEINLYNKIGKHGRGVTQNYFKMLADIKWQFYNLIQQSE